MEPERVKEWDEYYFNILYQVAKKSKDPHTKVGCLLVGPDREIRSTGFNSPPRGINDNIPERFSRENREKYKWCEHSERNAIYNAARVGIPLKGSICYVPWYPCVDCTRGLIQVGIIELVLDDRENNPWRQRTDWNMDVSEIMISEANITVRKWKPIN